jgi:hypothetical protein
MPRVVLLPPMPKSEIEELPEELRRIVSRYIFPLHNTILKLLQSTDESEFEHNFEKTKFEFLLYSNLTLLATKERHVKLLLKNYWKYASYSRAKLSHINKSLLQALVSANDIIINFIKLILEPDTTDFVPKRSDVYIPYLRLLVYTATLLYVVENNIVVNAKNVKTVIDKCGETTEIVESYFYTIKIDVENYTK